MRRMWTLPAALVMAAVVLGALGASTGSATETAAPGAGARERIASGRFLKQIEVRGENVPVHDRVRAETRLQTSAEIVDDAAKADPAGVAGRLATEFALPPGDLAAEKMQWGAWWSEIVIAHTLAANARAPITARQVFKLHDDGLGWSQIAYGLGLNLRTTVRAIQNECRVAAGRAPADGKVAEIRANDLGANLDDDTDVDKDPN